MYSEKDRENMKYYHEIVTCDDDLNCKFFYSADHTSRISKHWHNSFEVLYVLDGSLEVELDNSHYLLHAEDFILIHPRRVHSTTCRHQNESIVLQIPYPLLEGNVPNMEHILFACAPENITEENAEAAKSVRRILRDSLRVYQEKADGYSLKISSLLFELLFVLYRNFSELQDEQNHEGEKYLSRLEHVTSYVKNNYKQDISLTVAADLVGLNPEYFSRFFKKYLGVTFIEYLNTIRLEHCYADLRNTDSSISEIIEKNGFRNYKLFMRLFKKNYGCTPSEQRVKCHLQKQ